VGKDVSEVSRYIPSNDVEQSEHACPSPCTCLAEVGEVFQIVSRDVAVDGEFTGGVLLGEISKSSNKLTHPPNEQMYVQQWNPVCSEKITFIISLPVGATTISP
jgi:hypothetical protein